MDKARKIVKVIGFVIVLSLVLQQVSNILSRKDSQIKYHDFVTEKEEFDVLFFGNSHTINGIFPMELWEDYGIVSYNCAGHGNAIPTTYWVLKNVLEEKQPKLVVMDCFAIENNNKIRPERAGIDQQHISFDWKNLTLNKIGMMNYLFDDIQTRMEFLFPLSIYHERWEEITQKDYEVTYGVEKGAEYRVYRVWPKEYVQIKRDRLHEEDTLGKQYLIKIIEECQSRGIEILLLNIPYPASEEQQMWANSIDIIAKQYNVPYLNLFYENTGVDFATDCYDENSHLNPSGGRKVTEFVGKYIKEHYEITDKRQDSRYASWKEDYAEYTAFKWEQLKKQHSNMTNYLMLLADKNLSICLYFRGDSQMMEWSSPPVLIQNWGAVSKYEEAKNGKLDYFCVIDKGEVYEWTGVQEKVNQTMSFAQLDYSYIEGVGQTLCFNNEKTNYLVNEDGTQAEMAIVVFDNQSGKMIDSVRFNTNTMINTNAEEGAIQ